MSNPHAHPCARPGPRGAPVPRHPSQKLHYPDFPIPRRLVHDIQDNPIAIAVYIVIARRYLIDQGPITLSQNDLACLDPSTCYGSAVKALQRLVRCGWLIAYKSRGRKTSYVPTWGLIRAEARPWDMQAPQLGAPKHIETLRVNKRLVDTCLGRITPHQQRKVSVERWRTPLPILTLYDIGAYVLSLSGQPQPTSRILRYGLLQDDAAQPLPEDSVLLARASQPCLEDREASGLALTDNGLRRLGVALTPPTPAPARGAADLVFVSSDQAERVIQTKIQRSIPDMIQAPDQAKEPIRTLQNDQMAIPSAIGIATGKGDSGDSGDRLNPPLAPPTETEQVEGQQPTETRSTDEVLTTASAELLKQVGVFSTNIRELSSLPSELVRQAVDYVERTPGLGAGWVVTALRDARDHGVNIPRASGCVTAQGSMSERAERLRAQGITLTSGGDETACAATEPDYVELWARLQAAEAVLAPFDELNRAIADLRRYCGGPRLRPILEALQAYAAGDVIVLDCAPDVDRWLLQHEVVPLLRQVLADWELGHMQLLVGDRSWVQREGARAQAG